MLNIGFILPEIENNKFDGLGLDLRSTDPLKPNSTYFSNFFIPSSKVINTRKFFHVIISY